MSKIHALRSNGRTWNHAWGKLASRVSISLLNLAIIAPIGVVSKNFIGDPKTPPSAPAKRFRDAVNPAQANAKDLMKSVS
jgi:hypothetical protein